MSTATSKVLALDTSTDMLVCAVGEAGADVQLLASGDHLCRRQANVELVSTVHNTLEAAGVAMDQLDTIVVGKGPGSFTGVRIGISTAKGLACGLGKRLVGASVLDACAWNAWARGIRGRVGVVGDAMRGEVYPGLYVLDDDGARRTFANECVRTVDACLEEWFALYREEALQDTQLLGDGLKKYRSRFEEAGFTRILDEELWYPTGEGLLLTAQNDDVLDASSAKAGTGDPGLVLPIYTRLSDAEENERTRLGRPEDPQHTAATGVSDELADIHLQLRPMSINDCSAVAALEQRVFSQTHHEPWSEQVFLDEFSLPERIWWVAHDAGEICAYVGGVLLGDELEIVNVVVAPERRREGIAARLVSRVAYDAHVLNAAKAFLEVDASNDAAQALYGKLGFSPVGMRKNYYGPGHDAIIMSAQLPLVVHADEALDQPAPQEANVVWPPAALERSTQEQALVDAAAPLILAIESSCDETAMAVIDGAGRIISSVVATQVDFHARFGGVVPEIASRKHVEALVGVYEQTLEQAAEQLGVAQLRASDLAGVGVTYGPGLVGALVVGVAFAKGLCAACDLPLLAVNHLEGHIYANLLENPDLTPPFVASVVSGGNTMLVHVRDWGDYHILGETIDDAVGEAFDKVAKLLGLGYPGGPVISKLAEGGNPRAIRFPRAMINSGDYRFSLSGLKTSVLTYVEKQNAAGRPINMPDLCASFEAAVVDVQVAKALAAVQETGVTDFCLGGGVAANPALRAAYEREFTTRGIRVTIPPLSACTDNAQMIALVATRKLAEGDVASLDLDANPNLRLA